MKTDTDELLHQHAQRWSERQPPPPSLVAAVGHASGHRRSRGHYLAIAACVIVALAAAAIPVARSLTSAHEATRPGSPSTQTLARLSQIARSTSTDNGATSITAEAVHTTYLAAEHEVLPGVTNNNPVATTPVWVIQIRGSFGCSACKHPPDVPARQGHVLTMILVAATMQRIDFTVSDQPHDLTTLGSVITLNS